MKKRKIIKPYDLIIGGGGPAGLAIASEMRGNYLLLEKNTPGTTEKSWASWREPIRQHQLHPFVATKTAGGIFRTLDGRTIIAKDVLTCIIGEQRLLAYWMVKAAKNGWSIKQERITGMKRNQSGIIITTNRAQYATKLFVDAMGHQSPFLSLARPYDIFWWSCFGYRMTIKHQLKETIVIENVLEDPMTYYMYYPVGRAQGDPIVFFYSRKQVPFKIMREVFNRVKRKRPELNSATILCEKSGYIPLWKIKHPALDHMLFVGDIGGWTLNLTGTGFNSILRHYTQTARSLEHILQKQDFSKQSIEGAVCHNDYEKDNDALQKIFAHFMAHASSDILEKLFLALRRSETLLEKFVKGQLTDNDIKHAVTAFSTFITVRELFSICGARDSSMIIIEASQYLGRHFLSRSHREYHQFNNKRCQLCDECRCARR